MADRIEYEYLADDKSVIQALQRAQKENLKLEAQIQKLQGTSQKAGQAAVGSFSAIEKELKNNERALKRMRVGTEEFAAQKAKVDQLRQSLADARGQMAGAAQEGRRAGINVGRFVAQLGIVTAALGAVRAVSQAVVANLQKINEREETARLKSVEFEGAVAGQLPNIQQPDRARFADFARELADQEKLPAGAVAEILGNAASAGASLEQAAKAVRAANSQAAGNIARVETLTAAAVDFQTAGAAPDAEIAIGALNQLGQFARVTDAANLAKNFAPVIASFQARQQRLEGLPREFSSELLAVISQFAIDAEGAETATILKNFVPQLDQFVPKLEKTLKTGERVAVSQEEIDRFRSATEPQDALRVLQTGSEGLQKQFFDNLRRTGRNEIIRLVRLEGEDRATFERATRGIGSDAQVRQEFDQLAASVRDATQNLQRQQERETAVEQGRLTQAPQERLLAEARQITQDVLNETRSFGDSIVEAFGGTVDPSAAFQLRQRLGLGGDQTEISFLREFVEARREDATARNQELIDRMVQSLDRLEQQLVIANQQRADGVPVRQDQRPTDRPVPGEAVR